LDEHRAPIEVLKWPADRLPARRLSVSGDGALIALQTGTFELAAGAYSLSSRFVTWSLAYPESVASVVHTDWPIDHLVAARRDGVVLALLDPQSTINSNRTRLVFAPLSGGAQRELAQLSQRIDGLAASGDGRLVAAAFGKAVGLWRTEDGSG